MSNDSEYATFKTIKEVINKIDDGKKTNSLRLVINGKNTKYSISVSSEFEEDKKKILTFMNEAADEIGDFVLVGPSEVTVGNII